jgi:hypothetical protein
MNKERKEEFKKLQREEFYNEKNFNIVRKEYIEDIKNKIKLLNKLKKEVEKEKWLK